MQIKNDLRNKRFDTKKINLISVVLLCVCLIFVFFPISQKAADSTYTTDTTSYVMIDEIWNGETFIESRLNTLLQYVTGNDNLTVNNIKTNGSINQTLNSEDIRTKMRQKGRTYVFDDGSTSVTLGQDIQVTFGGLTWQAMYLTKDKSGEDILTLWLSSNQQDEWIGKTSGTSYTFNNNGALTSTWSAGSGIYNYYYEVTDTEGNITPSNMYSTSYIRTVTLIGTLQADNTQL